MMNVAFEDPFCVIGSTGIEVSPHLRSVRLFLSFSLYPCWEKESLPSVYVPMAIEEYEIDKVVVYPPLPVSHSDCIRSFKVIKVKKYQDVKPLRIRSFCEL